MKKRKKSQQKRISTFGIIILLLLAVAVLFRFCAHLPSRGSNRPTIQQTGAVAIPFTKHGELAFISHITSDTLVLIDIELANTDFLRARGLMFRESMPENAGMLFLMEREEYQSFWMRNTYISLDMLFVNADRQIVTIHQNTTILSDRGYSSTRPALYVVEVNAGFTYRHAIQVGDKIDFVLF